MRISGGRAQPVSSGETSRERNPDGENRNRNPNAAAAWGTASSGEMSRVSHVNILLPPPTAIAVVTMASDKAVAAIPVNSERNADIQMPGSANNARKPSRLK